ncbi:hypothetical protein NLN62_10635 [Bradyrhizobium sp. CCGUVB23]|nr:hypothetical protein [Bradyrhizobium sp. CCGUVB23]MCP3460758.1 hypothetical protein [Bradyrhizobium sp. CCGUVB23]
MDKWDSESRDLDEETPLTFNGKSVGEIAFGALNGFLDVRYGPVTVQPARSSHAKGTTRMTPSAVRMGYDRQAERLVGHSYIHNGDDSGFVCQRG